MDAGGLAQMSYNNFPSSNGLGMPGSGFASRRAATSNIKRLSFDPPRHAEPNDNGAPTPRTSRSHLLAGLRTAPKSATSSTFPSTAPPTQLHHQNGLGASIYAEKENYGGPRTSTYTNQQLGYGQMNGNRQMYAVPEQILAPPEIHVDEHEEQMDPNLYAQLVATNMYLAEQQQRLQQQLASVQAAAQQFQGMNFGMGNQMQQQFATPPITPQNMYQQQQVKNNMQPIITPVMGAQPGVYSYYNPVTGQQSYFMDNNAQQQNQYIDLQAAQQQAHYSPPQQPGTPRFQVSPPPQSETPVFTRSISPPKKSQSPPQDHAPLPPPSAGAFRRGHRKANSMAIVSENPVFADGPKSALLPKSVGFPPAQSATGFGPGQARAGEHPVRQPRGPPPLDELKAKPTTKFEGSKNFASRTRRSAVSNLVRAGLERRKGPGSSGSMSPVSETGDVTFSVSSDNDSDSGRSGSGSLSGRPSLGSSRTSAHGAIGSDRPSSRHKEHSMERKSIASIDSNFTTESVSSDEGLSVGGSFAAVFKNGGKKPEAKEVQRAPMLVLTSAEKRKSSLF